MNLSIRHLLERAHLLHDDVLADLSTPEAVITGTAGNDTLNGTSSNDTIDGLAGLDQMSGGGGADLYIVDNIGDVVIEAAGQGSDTIQSSVTYTLGNNVEKLVLTGSMHIDGTGNTLNNNITGNSGHNILHGGLGNDNMNGAGDGDKLYGEDGNDTLHGDGLGNGGGDTLFGGNGNDKIITNGFILEAHGDVGNDTMTGGTGTFGFFYGGTGADLLTGSTGRDNLYGEDGNDTLEGYDGNDILSGGNGNDLLKGGSAPFTEQNSMGGGNGNDTLVSGDGYDNMSGNGGSDQFVFTGASAFGDQITDFATGFDKIAIDQSDVPIGDGDLVIDGAVTLAGPGGFSNTAELVVMTNVAFPGDAAQSIGSATGNYAVGDTVVFRVGHEVLLFTAQNNNAQVEASELDVLTVLGGSPPIAAGDFIFVA